MAYNKKNRLKRIIEIQNIVLEHQKLGMTNKKIYELHIRPRFRISKRTFDEYLGVPAKRDLKTLIENETKPNQNKKNTR
jgi:hypothetical protein